MRFPTDVASLSAVLSPLVEALGPTAALPPGVSASPPARESAGSRLDRWLERAQAIERRAQAPLEDVEAGPLEAVLGFLEELETQLGRSLAEPERRALDESAIGVALWLVRYGARLERLELVVNAVARIANRTRAPADLAALSDVIGEILAGVTTTMRADRGDQNPGRPWRVLNLNHGIVATRSHDPARMERAFETLVHNLPADAAGFFREGMGQMEALDYPPEVRAVMQRHYQSWSTRTIH